MAHIECTLYYTLYTMCIHDNDVENCLLSLCGPGALSCLYSIEKDISDKTRNVGGHPQLVDPLVQTTSNHCVYTMG